MKLLAIDPGTERSALIGFDTSETHPLAIAPGVVTFAEILENRDAIAKVRSHARVEGDIGLEKLLIEMFDGRTGVPLGMAAYRTLVWIGRFEEAWIRHKPLAEVQRSAIKKHLCGSGSAKDANVSAALAARFAGEGGRDVAVGGKRCKQCKGKGWFGAGRPVCDRCDGGKWEHPPGPLHGIKADMWQALAVAVTYAERNNLFGDWSPTTELEMSESGEIHQEDVHG